MQIWERRVERKWHLLCLPRTGMDTGKVTQKCRRGGLRK
nr:MAG TPA: hypothetical protein [Caudoviricetes sp.]